MKIGVFDIGSNSIHMILADLRKDLSVEVLDRAKEFTRLGEGTFNKGVLSKEAMARGLEVLKRFKKLADIQKVQRIKAVATSAVREAANGGDFITRIEQETGIKVKVITGEEEGRLIGVGVRYSVSLSKTPVLILDIGGGSVEALVIDEKEIISCHSLKLGTLRLKDQFIEEDPPSAKELDRMEAHIAEAMQPVLEEAAKKGVKTIIGTSGTLINLVTMAHYQTKDEPISAINNYRIEARQLLNLHEQLISTGAKGRLKLKGIDSQRNDLLISGSSVLCHAIKKLGIEEIVLCEAAIREGLMYDYLERNRSKIELESQVPDLRLRSVLKLARKCDYRPVHAQQVNKLALSLFDQTKTLHRLKDREREWLHYAALLHDIGYHINYRRHHRHTYYLIKNANLAGFEAREVEMIANIARYHCKSSPKKSHENLNGLDKNDRNALARCASLLRLADALDRSHFSVVDSIHCRKNGRKVFFDVLHHGDPELEIWAAEKKKDLFEEAFGKQAVFVPKMKKKEATHA